MKSKLQRLNLALHARLDKASVSAARLWKPFLKLRSASPFGYVNIPYFLVYYFKIMAFNNLRQNCWDTSDRFWVRTLTVKIRTWTSLHSRRKAWWIVWPSNNTEWGKRERFSVTMTVFYEGNLRNICAVSLCLN